MSYLRVRWKNFRGFEDTKSLELRPLTVFIGANNAGKTSIFAPLLMLKQTLESEDLSLDLKPKGDIFSVGTYEDFIRNHDTKLPLSFELCWSIPSKSIKTKDLNSVGNYPPASLEILFTHEKKNNKIRLSRYIVRDEYNQPMLRRVFLESGRYSLHGIKLPKNTESVEAKIGNKSIRLDGPRHFLFDPDEIVRSILVLPLRQKSSNQAEEKKSAR